MSVSIGQARARAIASSPLKVGQVLENRVRIHRIVGVGGMAFVYEARRVDDGARVAVKCLPPALAADAACVERFLREAQATERVRSPHVVRIFETSAGGAGVPPYFVMEYLDGQDLGHALESSGPRSVAAAIDAAMQACAGVSEAHALGIVHRDIKPSNLIRCGSVVKVVDFGIAKSREPGEGTLTATSETFGSPSYMSPEQVRSAKRVDARTDVWSMGVVLYELLSGTVPFGGDNAGAILAAIVADEPPPLRDRAPHVPAALAAAVHRCLAKDRERRVQSMAELRALLAAVPWAEGEATQRAGAPRSLLRIFALGLTLALTAGSATYFAVARFTTRAMRGPSAVRTDVTGDVTGTAAEALLPGPPPVAPATAPTEVKAVVQSSRPSPPPAPAPPPTLPRFTPCKDDAQCGPLERCYPGGCSCIPDVMRCGDRCRRGGTARDDCGCGEVCGEDEVCVQHSYRPSCQKCPGATRPCGGQGCYDLRASNHHCGSCNHACAAGSHCFDGACEVSVPLGGGCEKTASCVTYGAACIAGTCQCEFGKYLCGGACSPHPCGQR